MPSNLRVIPGGSSSRVVGFAPGYGNRATSEPELGLWREFDGEVKLVLEDGVVRRIGLENTVVQRGTMHARRNTRIDVLARMLYVLLSCHLVEVNR